MIRVLSGYKLYPDITITRTLSLAVSLVDGYTDKQPVGLVNVVLRAKGRDLKGIKNRSHYYLFFDLPDAGTEYHVRVEADYYFDMDEPVSISALESLSPVVRLRLKPKPSYPFSSGTTLIRGMVKDEQGNLLSGAVVSTAVPGFSTVTTARGEFVCYYTGLKDDDIAIIDGKRFLKGGGDNTISLLATYDSLSGGVEIKNAVEGEVTVLSSPIVLNKT